MTDPLTEERLQYSIGGLVPYNEARARYYLVEILGKKEKIPLRFGLKDGTQEIEIRMRARYGAAYNSEYEFLLRTQLAGCEDDNEIWGAWRSEHAVLSVLRENLPKLPKQSSQDRILEWDSGSSSPTALSASPVSRKSLSIFPAESEFEQRVNYANSSHVPLNLPERPGGANHFMPKIFNPNETTPWDGEVSPTIRSFKKSLTTRLEELKGRKPGSQDSKEARGLHKKRPATSGSDAS